ncbi:MAG: response regulator [Devosia sp.]|uniref:response regulator n=1 Tax=Devosia sp. TaxID=1871048 RepID=UPI0024CBC509|nr:response regulator [Devosia sp.]UYO01153.1 MAG: response regulator [Devosia sp.]
MAPPLKLLAVDDDASSAELVVRIAERCGLEGFATTDSRGVINLVAALSPDILAVDVSMPHLDVFELFGLLSQEGYQGDIIVVSGQDPVMLEMTAKAADALNLRRPMLHQKPLDLAALRETFATLRAGRGA